MHVIVICIIRDNYVLGPVWAVHIEFNKKNVLVTILEMFQLPAGFSWAEIHYNLVYYKMYSAVPWDVM